MKFEPGKIVTTIKINECINTNHNFALFLRKSLSAYVKCDWGLLCDEDKELNDNAVKSGDGRRIMGEYIYPETGEKIWIITEADRSVTTVLFPEEY